MSSDLDRLRAAGLFLVPEFVSAPDCRRLVTQTDRAPTEVATVGTRSGDSVEDESRRTLRAEVAATEAVLDAPLAKLLPRLVGHFDEPLTAGGPAQVLVYRDGDFFRPHRDTTGEPTLPDRIRRRRISVVIFLNQQSPSPRDGQFSGGSLMFYRPAKERKPADAWLELRPDQGLLVAFRSDLIHEVRPVTCGRRCTAVTWFLAPSEQT